MMIVGYKGFKPILIYTTITYVLRWDLTISTPTTKLFLLPLKIVVGLYISNIYRELKEGKI